MNGMLEEGLGEVRRLTIAQIGEADAELDRRAAGALVRLRQGVTSANGVAVAGTDGFLFIANGANRWESQYLADPPVPIFWVAGWGALLSRRRGEAARRGVDLWNVVVPEKQVVLPEMRWPVPLPDGANRPVRKLQDALGEQGLFFYLADSLVEAKAHAPVYFRSNSHWTAAACCHAMRGLLRQAGRIELPEEKTFGYRETSIVHDLLPHFFDSPLLEAAGSLAFDGTYLFEHRPYATTHQFTGSRYGLQNPAAPDDRRILIFGDSFAYDAGLTAFLSSVFRETIFIWSKDVLWDEVDAHRPDIVLWESAERFLATIPEN